MAAAASFVSGSSLIGFKSTTKSRSTGGDHKVYFSNKNHVCSLQLKHSQCRSRTPSSVVKLQVATLEATQKVEAPIVIVTRASTGIGKATALALGKAGCKVLVNYARSSDEAEDVCKQIEDLGGQAFALRGDVSNESDVASMVKTAVDEWGTVDILVNNAGIVSVGATGPEIIDLNLTSVFLCTKEILQVMIENGKGRIINITGVSGTNEHQNYTESMASAAIAGVIGFTKSVAAEQRGVIQVTPISPGLVMTELNGEHFMPKTVTFDYGELEKEVVGMVEYLALNSAAGSGKVISINGGMVL